MDIRDYKGLKRQAARTLEESAGPVDMLVRKYSLVAVLLPFVINLIVCLLDGAAADTGGLDGMGTLAMIETIQELLLLIPQIFLPFWSVGLICMSMRLTRGERLDDSCLTTGFRIPGRVIGTYMLQGLFLSVAAIGAAYVGAMLAMPLMAGVAQELITLVTEESTLDMEGLLAFVTSRNLLGALIPAVLVVMAVMLVVVIPVSYRVSQTWYALLEGKGGAWVSIREGVRLTKKNCWNLFRLDLSFWWFYLAVWLLTEPSLLPGYLALVGVELGLGSFAEELAFGGASALGLLLLYCRCLPYVQTTYAYAYEALRNGQRPALEEPRVSGDPEI